MVTQRDDTIQQDCTPSYSAMQSQISIQGRVEKALQWLEGKGSISKEEEEEED